MKIMRKKIIMLPSENAYKPKLNQDGTLAVSLVDTNPMSAREWLELKLGGSIHHGSAQVKLMDEYAEYYHNTK